MKWALAAVVLLALLGLGLKWVVDERARNAPARPTVNVQSAWATFRDAPGHEKHVGEMGLDCAACHQTTDGGADDPGPQRCVTCHADQATLHHAVDAEADSDGGAPLSQCTDCHGFGPDPRQKPGDCLRCHAKAQGSLHAITVHARDDCLGCHMPHEDRVEARRCSECHQVEVQHGRGQHAPGEELCTTCHDPHAPAEVASDRCVDCHGPSGVKPVPATAMHGGRGCAGCHDDHRFTRATVKPCQSCHTDTHVLAGKGHRECTTCHEHHALSPSGAAVDRCRQCHSDVKPHHGDSSPGGSGGVGPTECNVCHVPHPKSGEARDTCLDCHALARTEASAHAGGVLCAQCHVPHDFDRREVTSCKSCHAARLRVLAKHAGHSDCATCHEGLPHLAGQPPLACGTCHEVEQAAVNPGHTECARCHEPHAAGKPAFACAGCHGAEAAAVGPGHAACGNCHDPHSGARSPQVADCSSCHDARRLPGLHRVGEHQTCTSCHSVHGEQPPATRASCLACHTEQRDHQPDATRCNGCHTFRGPGPRRSR